MAAHANSTPARRPLTPAEQTRAMLAPFFPGWRGEAAPAVSPRGPSDRPPPAAAELEAV